MTTDEAVRAAVTGAMDVGKVSHTEFASYVMPMERRKKGPGGWVSEAHPYMAVDGRLAMAVQDHIRQQGTLDIGPAVALVNTEDQLTLQVPIRSSLYGLRVATATSNLKSGAPIEAQHPWEVAETSAIGRALGMFGYGLLAGSGLTSAEDMQRVQAQTTQKAGAGPDGLSERQISYLESLYARRKGLADPAQAAEGLRALVEQNYGVPLEKLTQDQGKQLSTAMGAWPQPTGAPAEAKPAATASQKAPATKSPLLDTALKTHITNTLTQAGWTSAVETVEEWQRQSLNRTQIDAALAKVLRDIWLVTWHEALAANGLTEEDALNGLEYKNTDEVMADGLDVGEAVRRLTS